MRTHLAPLGLMLAALVLFAIVAGVWIATTPTPPCHELTPAIAYVDGTPVRVINPARC